MAEQAKALIFSEATSSEAFAERFSSGKDRKFAALIVAAVTHVHDLIKQHRPTQEEWRKLLAFLTEVGHASDEKRQEWVLLSDLIGASALVEEINSRRPKGATPNTIRGPFFRADAPERVNGTSISLDGIGEALSVRGQVVDLDGKPVTGAAVLTWQANAEGFYENQQPDRQPEHNLRGLFRTDVDGRFHYRSVMPSGYGVPNDGPVGRLLAEAGYPLHRPAHLHFVVRAPGFETITTHIYDAGDPLLSEDALFGVRPELVKCFEVKDNEGRRMKTVDLTFVMVRAKPGRAAR
ncbi:6-chlorohydroxyquinol-1,2-dioxygenase [Agrobacterium vitis]|uniref:6-chlorohydroxyquinol-1,2-dioxygenase n=1 Tax=Agrobacterium vitis TaxID=373 RepID=A0AAE2UR54_AGRVI|nr:dioxygenase [Agrobacterium vitis]MBF2714108.1 6-chlorohydroxyquinol-1,2-dioxygenase [Agrobacterium vitis]MUO81487.1 6-chlorohydroxyquinol-1,2-dioxygenase [Agrobacterium vitis]MUO95866.1 6-chlorohydroxyquinol-1,2-dioxygenase [Agrobacterium vitis]MVA93945.1 6-chlorohydroxyquinol-1,2-dioxygenase [Agrobacterium vitis]MVB03548.1 6-chlorohydroxyquinol-1,2-dioxygenase [Agrobacterium vitis]